MGGERVDNAFQESQFVNVLANSMCTHSRAILDPHASPLTVQGLLRMAVARIVLFRAPEAQKAYMHLHRYPLDHITAYFPLLFDPTRPCSFGASCTRPTALARNLGSFYETGTTA